MVAATPIGARVAAPRLTDVQLYAWIAQAEAGARLEYHRGFLGIDVTPQDLGGARIDGRASRASLPRDRAS